MTATLKRKYQLTTTLTLLLSSPLYVAPMLGLAAIDTFNPIDTTNRVNVKNLYNQYYTVPMPSMSWTGSVSTCTAGTISTAFSEWTISRVNFSRAMAGLPGNITLDSTNSAKAQQAALMMAAQGSLSHSPPTTWACYTASGAEAAGFSNLALGFGLSSYDDVIPRYMDDSGVGNQFVGHRRWILYPPQANMGVGSIPTSQTQWGASALWVLTGFGSRPPTPNGTAWPPRGFVPLALFPPANRWSFSYPSANFATAAVTMSLNGTPVALNVVSRTDSFGDNTIVWEPTTPVTKNTSYNISITGVTGSSVPTSFTYVVQPFDPADPIDVTNDFNTDGKSDLLWHNTSNGQNAVWFMDGITYLSSAGVPATADTNWHIVGTPDLNADGKPDLLWRNYVNGQNAVWYFNGSSFAGSASILATSDTNWHIVGTPDMNADGKPDLLWRNFANGQNAVWFMDGASYLSSVSVPGTNDTNWHIVGTPDLNADGKPDLLWRNYLNGQNAVWYLNGANYLSGAVVPGTNDTNWHIVATPDLNSDGKPDLLWRNYLNGQNAVWYLNGVNYLSSAVVPGTNDTNWTIVNNGDN